LPRARKLCPTSSAKQLEADQLRGSKRRTGLARPSSRGIPLKFCILPVPRGQCSESPANKSCFCNHVRPCRRHGRSDLFTECKYSEGAAGLVRPTVRRVLQGSRAPRPARIDVCGGGGGPIVRASRCRFVPRENFRVPIQGRQFNGGAFVSFFICAYKDRIAHGPSGGNSAILEIARK